MSDSTTARLFSIEVAVDRGSYLRTGRSLAILKYAVDVAIAYAATTGPKSRISRRDSESDRCAGSSRLNRPSDSSRYTG